MNRWIIATIVALGALVALDPARAQYIGKLPKPIPIDEDRTNRSASALGLKPHQVRHYMEREFHGSDVAALSLRLIQSVPYPEAVETQVPTQEVKNYYARCKEIVKTVLDTIEARRTLSKSEATTYDKCLGKLTDLPAHVSAWMNARVVLIQHAGSTPEWPKCTGLAFSSRQVVTARHCFYDRQNILIPWSEINVHTLANPGGAVKAANAPMDANSNPLTPTYAAEIARTGDIAFLNLAADIALGDSSPLIVQGAPLKANERRMGVVIPGFSGMVASALGRAPSPTEAAAFVRVDTSGECFIQRVGDSGCYIHSCQTAPGTSGAPVLAFDSLQDAQLKPTLLAVHSGAWSERSDCPAAIPYALRMAAPNIANFPQGPLFQAVANIASSR